jgi:hypothetical protein
MADSGGRTQVMIALIGLTSAIGVALIANYDKIFPRASSSSSAGQSVANPAETPGKAAETPASSGPPAADQPPPAAQDNGTAAAPPGDGKVNNPIQLNPNIVKMLVPAKVAGLWLDESDPYRFAFTQDGVKFSYTASENGAARGTGKGTVFGKTLTYSFEDGSYTGNCRATVADDGNHISGTCTPNSGDAFDVKLKRGVILIPPQVLFKPHI